MSYLILMDFLESDIIGQTRYLWLIGAFALLLLEALGAGIITLVYAGLAAFAVSALIAFDILSDQELMLQGIIWLGITGLLALLLYRPRHYRRSEHAPGSAGGEIIGRTARVASGGLMVSKPGKVYLGDTLMNAQIAPHSQQEAFMEGELVEVEGMRGNYLLVLAPAKPLTSDEPILDDTDGPRLSKREAANSDAAAFSR